MDVQRINEKSLVVFYSLEDLKAQGMDPTQLESSSAERLAKLACELVHIPVTGHLEIDAYNNISGMLLFAHIRDPQSDVYSLLECDDLEKIIGAAHTIHEVCAPPSTLIYYNLHYYLAFHACEQNPSLVQLRKFGNSISSPDQRYLFLCQHGTRLFCGNAITAITRFFHR